MQMLEVHEAFKKTFNVLKWLMSQMSFNFNECLFLGKVLY